MGTIHSIGVLPQPNQGMANTLTGIPFSGAQVRNDGTHDNLHGTHGVNNVTGQHTGAPVGQMVGQVVGPGGPTPSNDAPGGPNIGGCYSTVGNSTMVMPPGSVHLPDVFL